MFIKALWLVIRHKDVINGGKKVMNKFLIGVF
jgi:hypothetical protein